jgi:hypothetical protein
MAQSRVSGLDETTNKYPTITIAIIGHGEDLINEPISEDPNIRIFSRAGQPFCLGIGSKNMLKFVENLYMSTERDSNKNTKSSYQMLREVAEHYNTTENNTQFKGMCDRLLTEKPNDSPLKHTKQNIECKKHNQIFTPFYDHTYFFTDNTSVIANQNGIYVLETLNHISRSNIDYEHEHDANLALNKFFIKYSDIKNRKKFNEDKMEKFLAKFNLGPDLETNIIPEYQGLLERTKNRYPPEQVLLNKRYKDELDEKTNIILSSSKIKRYSKAIVENFPFLTPTRLINNSFSNETSEIHTLFGEDDDNIIKAKAKELSTRNIINMNNERKKAIEEKDEERGKQIAQKIEELRAEKQKFVESENDNPGMIERIKLSEIIAFLKSEGFVIINIIDFSCRFVSGYLDDAYGESELEEHKIKKDIKKERIREYEENQSMGFEGIRKDKGGRKKHRTKRKKSKRKNKKTKRNKMYYKNIKI